MKHRANIIINPSNNHKYDFRYFKQSIDLTQYAASLGYSLDQKKSTAHLKVMRFDKTDKIIVSRQNAIWVYFSVYDDNDNGTIIDFIKNRKDQSYLEIAKELHHWSGETGVGKKIQYVSNSSEGQYAPLKIQGLFNRCTDLTSHTFLLRRGLNPSFLQSPRFSSRIFQDAFDNVVFPHFKQGTVRGLELRNEDMHLFVKGSEKTFWRSNVFEGDTRLFIAESPIDAMSYQALYASHDGFYMATCGGFSKKQQVLLESFMKHRPTMSTVVIITDHDQGGHRIALKIIQVLETMNFKGTIQRHSPCDPGKDWNDVLMEKSRLLMSSGGATAKRLSEHASEPRCMEP